MIKIRIHAWIPTPPPPAPPTYSTTKSLDIKKYPAVPAKLHCCSHVAAKLQQTELHWHSHPRFELFASTIRKTKINIVLIRTPQCCRKHFPFIPPPPPLLPSPCPLYIEIATTIVTVLSTASAMTSYIATNPPLLLPVCIYTQKKKETLSKTLTHIQQHTHTKRKLEK